MPEKCPHHGGEAPPEGVDPRSYRVFQAFMRTMHLYRQLMVRAVQSGSSLGHAGCLRILSHHDGMSQRDLAERMHLSRPSVTVMLQALEKDGAVERRPDEKDQRLTRVYITDHGRELAEQMRTELARFVNETIGGIPEADRERLAELLEQLGDNTASVLERVPNRTTDHEKEKR